MRLAIPRETHLGENRASVTPETVKKLVHLGADVIIEAGAGTGCGISDDEYTAQGAVIESDRDALLGSADMVLRLRKPENDEVAKLKSGCIHVSYLDPFNEHELIKAFAANNITAVSMEMIPRSTRSQKMDALSSQANLAGYVAVMLAATRLPRIFPMMMTPAGTLKPAKVFIIGAGVAGLQAIATAKRLGAKVTAFDTRPVVAEQVQSLGGKFLEIDLGDTGQTKDADMVAGMAPGSVIVDMAAETGGNVEGSVPNEVVNVGGVTIVGTGNLANEVARDATTMYANNLYNLVEDSWDKEAKEFVLDLENDILPGCVITHGGAVVHPTIKDIVEGAR